MKNDHIVARIHPFVMQQEVDVYQDGACVKTVECNLNEIDKVIYSLAKEFDIQQIDLAGNQLYAMKIRDDLGAAQYEIAGMKIDIH